MGPIPLKSLAMKQMRNCHMAVGPVGECIGTLQYTFVLWLWSPKLGRNIVEQYIFDFNLQTNPSEQNQTRFVFLRAKNR